MIFLGYHGDQQRLLLSYKRGERLQVKNWNEGMAYGNTSGAAAFYWWLGGGIIGGRFLVEAH